MDVRFGVFQLAASKDSERPGNGKREKRRGRSEKVISIWDIASVRGHCDRPITVLLLTDEVYDAYDIIKMNMSEIAGSFG